MIVLVYTEFVHNILFLWNGFTRIIQNVSLHINCSFSTSKIYFLPKRREFYDLKNIFIWYDTCQVKNTSLSCYSSFQKIHLNFRWENHKNITEHNSSDISFKRILQLPSRNENLTQFSWLKNLSVYKLI